jgi:hypothetical protein
MLHPCEHSRINILQWILTKLGTYLVLRRVWNTIDFQGQRSRSQGLIFRRGDTPCFALPLFIRRYITTIWNSKKFTAVKFWPGDIDLWPWKSIVFQTLLWTKYVPSLVKIHWRILILECSQHLCEHSRINILQWILTTLGTYLVLRRVWNPIGKTDGRTVALLYPFATSLTRG